MTHATTATIQIANQTFARREHRSSDAAPMVITRLSGWIDVGEIKTEARAWIIPTRVHTEAR